MGVPSEASAKCAAGFGLSAIKAKAKSPMQVTRTPTVMEAAYNPTAVAAAEAWSYVKPSNSSWSMRPLREKDMNSR